MKKGNTAAKMGMVQWSNLFDENAIWEDLDELSSSFQAFVKILEGKNHFKKGELLPVFNKKGWRFKHVQNVEGM